MGREVFHLATQCEGYNKKYRIKGFLDDNLKALDSFEFPYPKVLDKIEDYEIQKNDVFAISIGDVKTKKRIIENFVSKGGYFISLIDPNCKIAETAKTGNGCLIFHDVHIGSEVIVGDYVMLQSYAALGHDVVVGNYTRIDPKVSCVGGTIIGNNVTLHTMCVINHKVVIEDDAVVGALSFVIRKVKKGTTVWGIPAKVL